MHTRVGLVVGLLVSGLLGTTASADTSEAFFRADSFECFGRNNVEEWRIRTDPNKGLEFSVYRSRDGVRFDRGRHWQLANDQVSETVTLHRRNEQGYRITGPKTDQPVVRVLGAGGSVVDRCHPTLRKVDTPDRRYVAAFLLVNTLEPTPNQALELDRVVSSLPPIALLPVLDQANTETALESGVQEFWERFREVSLRTAADTTDTTILSGLVEVALEQKSAWAGQFLKLAQDVRALALLDEGALVQSMRVADRSVLCERVDGFAPRTGGFSHGPTSYLELAVGLPLEFWSQAIAEEYLEDARQCDEMEYFSDTVGAHWPAIQEKISGFQLLTAERKRLASLEITIPNLVSSNWLTLDGDLSAILRRAGFATEEISRYFHGTFQQKRDEAISVVPALLVAELDTLGVPLSEYPHHCAKRKRELAGFSNAELVRAIFSACDEALARLFESIVVERIHDRLEEITGRPGTVDGLIETNGFTVGDVVPEIRFYDGPFTEAMATIRHETALANAATSDLFQVVLESLLAEIEAAFESAGPLTEEADGSVALCAPFVGQSQLSSNERLKPVRDICHDSLRDLEERRDSARCDEVWREIGAPPVLRDASLSVDSLDSRPFPFSELICGPTGEGLGLRIERVGLLSTNYRLVRRKLIDGVNVELSFTLVDPDSDSATWTFGDFELRPGGFQSDELATSNDAAVCLLFLEQCYRNR